MSLNRQASAVRAFIILLTEVRDKMKVFLSWSGEPSASIAMAFKEWLPSALQAVQPYFSPEDLQKGSRWSSEIATELEASSYGILFLTMENRNKPWMLFEAGALSKKESGAKLFPILIDFDVTELEGPLTQFQCSRFAEDEIRRILGSINDSLDSPLSQSVLDNVFAMWWPKLKRDYDAIIQRAGKQTNDEAVVKRSDRDLLEEVLTLVRASRSVTYANSVSKSLDSIGLEINNYVAFSSMNMDDKQLVKAILTSCHEIAVLPQQQSLKHRFEKLLAIVNKLISDEEDFDPFKME